MPIFESGKLKPGIYRIQNIVGQTYVDIREHSKELCCRPATLLEGKGLWEILPSGPGYTIRRLEHEMPEQFCTMLSGLNGYAISVATFPMAWRVEIANDGNYQGHEYVRFFWGSTNFTWDLDGGGSNEDRKQVYLRNNDTNACRVWKLKKMDHGPQLGPEPAPVPNPELGPVPPYDGNPVNQRCVCGHRAMEADDDEHVTTVTEVTVTTTTNTTTTRKKYRVEEE